MGGLWTGSWRTLQKGSTKGLKNPLKTCKKHQKHDFCHFCQFCQFTCLSHFMLPLFRICHVYDNNGILCQNWKNAKIVSKYLPYGPCPKRQKGTFWPFFMYSQSWHEQICKNSEKTVTWSKNDKNHGFGVFEVRNHRFGLYGRYNDVI